MIHDMARVAHIVLGSAGVALYWAALLALKGGARHRAAGRVFFGVLIAVVLSVGPVLVLRAGPFDPGRVVQFVYLALCLVTVTRVSWTAIAWNGDLARFRGVGFRVLGAVILVLGLVLLAAGIAKGSLLTMVFSWVGLTYGTAMLRFAWMRAPVHPRWSLIWHLNGVAGLFNAVHGTLLALGWRVFIDSSAGEGVAVAMQLLTMAAGLALRLWYGARRGAPLRLSAESDGVLAVVR